MQKKRKKISENKQYITVDNSSTLLYTVNNGGITL